MGVTISAYMFWTHDRLGAERQPDDNPRNLVQRNEPCDVQSCAVQRTRNLLLLKGVIYLRRAWHGAHSATARSAHFTHNGSEGLVGRLARRYDCRYAGKHQLEDRGQLQRPQRGRLLHRAQHRFGIQRRFGLGLLRCAGVA